MLSDIVLRMWPLLCPIV